MKAKFFNFVVVLAVSLTSVVTYQTIQALVLEDVQYPVEELGSCQSEADCKNYCSQPDNADRCLDFAVKEGLMSSQEVDTARKFLTGQIQGPGGCSDKATCEDYCNDISKADECISFAEENNLLPPAELQEFKQVQAAIKRGVTPPACKNKEECEAYCEEPSHMEECVNFGVEAGFLTGQEKEDAQKMLQAIKRGVKPPPCRGRSQCEEFCSEPENMEQCMAFALEAGFMSEVERENAQKMVEALKKGVKPLPCKGKETCEAYCSVEEHLEECFTFAQAAGFMTEEEAQMARKTGGKGPGNCKGKEECESFCQDPANQETCMNFAKEHGLLSEEDARMMEEGGREFSRSMEQAPPEVLSCLEGKVGSEMAEKIKQGVQPTREIGEVLKECFSQMQGQQMQGQEGDGSRPMPPEGFGSCNSPEECEKFMMQNREGMNPEMMRQEGQMPSFDQPIPQEYQQHPEEYKQQLDEQFRQQYEQQPQQMEEQQRFESEQQYQQQPQLQSGEPYQEPVHQEETKESQSASFKFGSGQLLGALVYTFFDLLFGR